MTKTLAALLGRQNPAQFKLAPARIGPPCVPRIRMLGAQWRANPQTGLLECKWSADPDDPLQTLVEKFGMTLAI